MVNAEDELAEIADAIREARDLLEELYVQREALVEQAIGEGMSLRQIGEVLGVSHVAVAKIAKGREAMNQIAAILGRGTP